MPGVAGLAGGEGGSTPQAGPWGLRGGLDVVTERGVTGLRASAAGGTLSSGRGGALGRPVLAVDGSGGKKEPPYGTGGSALPRATWAPTLLSGV